MKGFGKIWKKYLKTKYNSVIQLKDDWIPDEELVDGEKTQARQCYEFYNYLQKNQEVKFGEGKW